MAWLFLPENEQVQYLQKIAQMRKKSIRTPTIYVMIKENFLHEVQFSAAIEAAHFPAGGTAIDASAAAIFTLLLYHYFVCQMAMGISAEKGHPDPEFFSRIREFEN